MAKTGSPGYGTDTAKNAADSVSAGTTSSVLVAANPSRVALYVTNNHASNTVDLAFGGTAVAGKGPRLQPNGSLVLDPCSYTGAVTVIASGASTTVGFAEI